MEIDVDFESSSALKDNMMNPEVFKDLNDLEQELAQEGLPYIGKV